MKETKWTRLGARVCALSLTAAMTLAPGMAQAMSLNVNYTKGTLAVHGTNLKEGLAENPVDIVVRDENGEKIYATQVNSSADHKFYTQIDASAWTKQNTTYTVYARSEKTGEEKTTIDEASREFTTPAQDIVLSTPQTDANAQSVTISGTAQDGVNVLVGLSGASTVSQVVTANGGAFTASFQGLAYGDYQVAVTYADETVTGNGASTGFTLREPAPQIAQLTVTAQGGENTATVIVKGEPGADVTVSLDGQKQINQLSAEGTCTFVFSGVTAGEHTVQVGDSYGQSAGTTVTVTDQKPVIEQRDIAVTKVTPGVESVRIEGTASVNAAVSVSGFGKAATVNADASGNFVFTLTGVAAGTYDALVVSYEDTAVYTGKPANMNGAWTVTPRTDDISIAAAVGGVGTLQVSGTARANEKLKISARNETTGAEYETNTASDANGYYALAFPQLAAGTYTVTVSYQTAGIGAAAKQGGVTVTAVPTVQTDIVISNATGGTGTLQVSGTAKANEKLAVSVRNEATGTDAAVAAVSDANGYYAQTVTNLAAGTYTVTVSYQTAGIGAAAARSGVAVTATPSVQPNIVINSATGGNGTIQVTGTAKANEKLVVSARNEATGADVAIASSSDANGYYSQTLSGLATGRYTVTVSYLTPGLGMAATRAGVVVNASVPSIKQGIKLDKLFESSLTVVGKTSPGCNVTVRVNYSGKEVSISRVSGTDGVFRIPLPRTLPKHTELTATVTYADGTTETTTGHIYAGSAEQEYNQLYRVGSVGNAVYDIEDRLKQLGYPISPDRVYDSETERIVCIFQRNNGLAVDGMVGSDTLAKLNSVTAVGYTGTTPPTDYIYLTRGSRGSLVSQVQTRLKELGYYTIRVDGIFGVGTQTAVRAFQRNNGLSVTGVVNSECYQAMMAANAIGVNNTGSSYVELRRGNRGNAVVRLQARLQYLGYYTISVDGIYGSGTQTAVRRFQSRNGISASGVATVYTQQVLFSSSAVANSSGSSSSSTGYVYLHYGSNGAAVKRLQQALKNAGYYKGAVDGQYYDQTYAAVKAFQRAKGLSVDGIAGRKTQNALYGTQY